MLPFTNQRGTHYLKLSEFSGGTNYAQSPEVIHNTQLADCKNVWFRNGVLKTRPSISFNTGNSFIKENTEKINVKVIVDKKNTAVINGEKYVLEITVTEPLARCASDVDVRYVSKENALTLGSLTFELTSVTVLPVQYKGDVYLYLHGYDGNYVGISSIYRAKMKKEGEYEELKRVTQEEIYTPLVLTNCWPCYGDSGKVNSVLTKGAAQVEGFNLLGNRYKMEFSTFDNSPSGYRVFYNGAESDDCFSYMEYSLPYTKDGCSGDISVEYTDINGKIHYHTVSCPSLNSPTVEEGENEDGTYLHACIKGGVCHIEFKSSAESDGTLCIVSNFEYVNNNMTVTAPCENTLENWEKVCGMTQAVWYGNNSLGISGGSRLFFCGGKDALVVWSDFENPLYFPENNYAYVGDKTQRTTAFGKQGSSLIIFKENEIYSTQYTQGDVTAKELMDQSVIDVTTSLAYFPMTLIHPHIGCDCPESIQLCRNRLVFASSSGNVYVITGQNQFSERNVYEVSELISPRLKNEDMKKVTSADWNGNYLLFTKRHVYIMDYNSYGYVNISSYTRDEVGNRLIPWFVWEFGEEFENTAVIDGSLFAWAKRKNEKYLLIQPFYMNGDEDKDKKMLFGENGDISQADEKISSMIMTKHFDFNEPHRIKVIEKVLPELIKEAQTVVSFISESNIPDTHNAFINSFIPKNKYVKRLGILIKGEGRIALTNVTVLFRKGNYNV